MTCDPRRLVTSLPNLGVCCPAGGPRPSVSQAAGELAAGQPVLSVFLSHTHTSSPRGSIRPQGINLLVGNGVEVLYADLEGVDVTVGVVGR